MDIAKQLVKDFWNQYSCGEQLYMVGEDLKARFKNQLQERLRLEPFIPDFAEFSNWKGKDVLEIGVGLGADHQLFAEHGAKLKGCDLTERAVEYTKQRLNLFNLHSDLTVADAENLPYSNEEFDLVYSYGVIHVSPNTPQVVSEIHRVLKKNGTGKIMIYYKYSIVGFMLWIRYALFKGRPWLSLDEIYSKYLESPGTKAYSINQARELFKNFSSVEIHTVLSHGDLLSSQAGQRHKGFLLDLARIIHPRWIIKTFFNRNGLFMFVDLKK